jgi:hypothetical protein
LTSDEELLDTRPAGWSRRRRTAAGAAVVLAIGALLVATVARHDHGGHRQTQARPRTAAPSPLSPAPSSIIAALPPIGRVWTAPPTPLPAGSLPYRTGNDPSKCPGLRCATRHSAPNQVGRAVLAAFPGARITRVTTVRLDDRGRRLWFREVVATSARSTVQLVVQAHSPADVTRGYVRIEPGAIDTYVERNRAQWHVFVTVTAPTHSDRAYGRALELAGDARILAT